MKKYFFILPIIIGVLFFNSQKASGLTFGYTNKPVSSTSTHASNYIHSIRIQSPANGTVTQLSFVPYGYYEYPDYWYAKPAIYLWSDKSLLGVGEEYASRYSGASFKTVDMVSDVSITSGTDYVLSFWGVSQQYLKYDSGGTSNYSSEVYDAYDGNFPATLGGTFDDDIVLGIYATYTAGASDTCTPPVAGDWYINSSDNCYITGDTYINGEVHLLNRGEGGLYIIDGAVLYTLKLNSTSTPVYIESDDGSTIGGFIES